VAHRAVTRQNRNDVVAEGLHSSCGVPVRARARGCPEEAHRDQQHAGARQPDSHGKPEPRMKPRSGRTPQRGVTRVSMQAHHSMRRFSRINRPARTVRGKYRLGPHV
jgi:hypothetical protein